MSKKSLSTNIGSIDMIMQLLERGVLGGNMVNNIEGPLNIKGNADTYISKSVVANLMPRLRYLKTHRILKAKMKQTRLILFQFKLLEYLDKKHLYI